MYIVITSVEKTDGITFIIMVEWFSFSYGRVVREKVRDSTKGVIVIEIVYMICP